MKKTFKVFRDGKWEEIELEVEQSGPFIEYTPPKDMIPPVMGFVVVLTVFIVFASAVAIVAILLT